MLTQWLNTATRYLWRWVTERARNVLSLRARYRAIKEALETVVGCDTGHRYRIFYGRVVHQIDDAGQPVTGWCFVPSGGLVAGDVMLVQKIALETNEQATLDVANRFNVKAPGRGP